MIRSFQRSHLEQQLYLHKHPFNSQELAELLWLIGHMNLENFLSELSEHRKYQLRFEDLVSRPQEMTAALCQRFGLAFFPDLLKPLEHPQADSMKVSTVEPHFKTSVNGTGLPAGTLTADAFQQRVFETDQLSDITREMAEAYGYYRETIRPIASGNGNSVQISENLNKRKEFIGRQRQRRMVHRKHRVKGRKLV
jgi:hypothetical protein